MKTRLYILFCIQLFTLLCANSVYATTQNDRNQLVLTPDEKAWLAAHPIVRVRISRTYPPFEFFAQNRFQGLSYDHLTLIGNMLGIKFQPAPDMPWRSALESLKNKDGIDLVLMITRDTSRENFIEFTEDFLSFPQIIITRKDSKFISGVKDLSGGTVVTENGFIKASPDSRRVLPCFSLEMP